jgi:hypothetical protein
MSAFRVIDNEVWLGNRCIAWLCPNLPNIVEREAVDLLLLAGEQDDYHDGYRDGYDEGLAAGYLAAGNATGETEAPRSAEGLNAAESMATEDRNGSTKDRI